VTELIPLKEIILDPEIQPRVELNREAVLDYIDKIGSDEPLPPADVFQTDEGYVLADGFHRFEAHRLAGKRKIEVNLLQGDRRDAFLHGVRANQKHGVRFTNADKNKICTRILKDPEWSKISEREISRMIGVSQAFVTKLKAKLLEAGEIGVQPIKIVKRGGQTYELDTSKINPPEKYEKEVVEVLDQQQGSLLTTDTLYASEAHSSFKDVDIDIEIDDDNNVSTIEQENEVPTISPERILLFSHPKQGTAFSMGTHKLFFNTLAKSIKKLEDYDCCLWFGTVKDLKKHRDWILSNVDLTVVITNHGLDVIGFPDLGLKWQAGSIVGIGKHPYFIGYFSENLVTVEDFESSDSDMVLYEFLSQQVNSILVVDPPFKVLPAIESLGKVATIVSGDATYAQTELLYWEEHFSKELPITNN
jgi:hypothetical protein